MNRSFLGMLAENLFKIGHLPIRKLDTRNFYKLSGQAWVEDGEKVLEGISQINDLETLEVEDVRYTEAIMGTYQIRDRLQNIA